MKKKAKVKVIGVGGSGGNALTRMAKCHIQGVELIAVNSDLQDLKKTKAHKKIQIGRDLTQGLGTGMNPKTAQKAALESLEDIKSILSDGEIVFLTCGLGGGTGSGVSPIIAQTAKEAGALTIGVITLPFSFEGFPRKRIANQALGKLKNEVDTLFTISNDKLLNQIDDKTKLDSAFWLADEILRQAVFGISDLILSPGLINVDFADVETIMKDSGFALFGVGVGKGENRAEEAALQAINSPFIDFSVRGAKGILFNIAGGNDLSLDDVEKASKIITQNVSPSAKIIFGANQNRNVAKGTMKITVIATGVEK